MTAKIGPGEGMLSEDRDFHGLDVRREWRLVLEFEHEDFAGVVVEDDDGAALSWNDFVVNTWVELYSSTPLALVRLAVLLQASDDARWFKTSDPLEFAQTAHVFLDEQLVSGY